MKQRTPTQAFTLLELLVAVTITLLLVGLILSVTTNVLNLWRRSQGSFSAATEAKLALDLLERDLRGAIYRRDNGNWLVVTVASDISGVANHGWVTTGTIKPGATESMRLLPDLDARGERRIADARFGFSGAWLRFISTNVDVDSTMPSMPIAIAYQIARRPITGPVSTANSAPSRYTLFRSIVAKDATFASGYNITAAPYASSSNTPSASQRAASTITNPVTLLVLATNVVDFGVWLYARNADGSLRRIFPSANNDLTHVAVGSANAPDDSRMPEVADVMLRILSEEGATLVENIETGRTTRPAQYANDAEWWWAVADANSRVYVRRVLIEGVAP